MTSPLSPAANGVSNAATPPTARRSEDYEIHTYTIESKSPIVDKDDDESSPFISCVEQSIDQENISPSKRLVNDENVSPTKSQHPRVQSGDQLSPLKILSEQRSMSNSPSPRETPMPPPSLPRSPKKMSPIKRFPIKVSNPLDEDTMKSSSHGHQMSLDTAMEENEGLKHAIEIFEDEQSMVQEEDRTPPMDIDQDDEAAGPDDTMVSTFSTFSAVPNMTMFAKLGSSPLKMSQAGGRTPRKPLDPTSEEAPRPASKRDSGNTTNLLMDFTEQLRNPSRSPAKGRSHDVAATPDRRFSNLLDFDIPPMPTPRSVPSVTPRELESLKSSFLSEISSLKASLSGKEAEVSSLKTAVGDAEKRVGETHEQLREEQLAKQQLGAEKEDWENRGREMEQVLRKVKGDIVSSENERQELEQKLEESEKRREAAEMLHQEAESKMAGMRAGRDSDKSSPDKAKSPDATNREVEVAVERVARELHGLYKSKHETKVSALKKSYESRWSKKIKELETKIDDLGEDNERLRTGRDATLTKVEPGSAEAEELKARAVKDSTAMKEFKADIERLEAVVSTVQRDNVDLRGMLEKERVEKGELVQLAEELMGMQSTGASFIGSSSQQAPTPTPKRPQQQAPARDPRPPHPEAPVAKTPKTSHEGFKGSASRASGLRAPGSLRAPQEKTKSGGLPRPGGGVGRSGIMNSIEKMGSYRGRGGD